MMTYNKNQNQTIVIEKLRYKKLQIATCNSSMLRVFDFIKGKKIDESKITVIEPSSGDISNTAKWYKGTDGTGIVYIDFRDPKAIYMIAIDLHDTSNCCNSNPVKTCMCDTGTFPCILTLGIDLNIANGATATCTATGGVIQNTVQITNPGSGYSEVPSVRFIGVGSGATATATISSGTVTGINVTNGGIGYTSFTTVSIDPPFGADIPNNIIDYSISILPIKSYKWLYIGAAVGLGAVILLLRRK